MERKYDISSETPSTEICEDVSIGYESHISPTDALWALIVNQTQEVQQALADRLTRLCRSRSVEIHPYTFEELDQRITESEQQMESSDVISGTDVHQQMRNFVNSLAI